jgi:hypothetical protein
MKLSKEELEIAPKLVVSNLTKVSSLNVSNFLKFLMLDILSSSLETQVALNQPFGKSYKLQTTLLHLMRKNQMAQRT